MVHSRSDSTAARYLDFQASCEKSANSRDERAFCEAGRARPRLCKWTVTPDGLRVHDTVKITRFDIAEEMSCE